MENVDKKNIGLPSRYINALYELCDEAKNLKKITQDFEKFIKLVEDNKNLNNILFSPTVGKTNQGKVLNDILKKGKADKERSKIFSKLSKEITVAAKLGDKDPAMNPRLRSAVQAARSANMPKDNIARAIDKSSISDQSNFENLRYEGFGPFNIALIIETLTENKKDKGQ